MKITCNHWASRDGIPVILDDAGRPMGYQDGLRAVCGYLGWSRARLAAEMGLVPRSVERWFLNRIPPVTVLNLLGVAVERHDPDAPPAPKALPWAQVEQILTPLPIYR